MLVHMPHWSQILPQQNIANKNQVRSPELWPYIKKEKQLSMSMII